VICSRPLVAIEVRSGACTDLARFVRVGDEVAAPAVVVVDRWQRLVRELLRAADAGLVARARAFLQRGSPDDG
jgi:hypothetical protein